jgi:flavin-dependent dehydrogenase
MSSVAIIGAGPAGCAAAFALASRGWDVTLIEQHRFPRDKVCGECLSALGLQTLAQLGVIDRLRVLDPVILNRATLHAPNGASADFTLPQPMWGLSRIALDTALLTAARDAGAQILQPARCESMNGTLSVRNLTDNTIGHLNPDWTLLADGKSALLPTRPPASPDLGIKAHFANVQSPRDTIDLFGVQGHYIGVAPIEHDRWNVAFSIPICKLRRLGGSAFDFDNLWAHLLTRNRTLAARFAHAGRCSDWITTPLPRFAVRSDWPSRVIPLGNAAAALEPISGEGMGLALRSAAMAADALTSPSPDLRQLQRRFTSMWRTRRLASRALAHALGSPIFAALLIQLARGKDTFAAAVMSLIGKSPVRFPSPAHMF